METEYDNTTITVTDGEGRGGTITSRQLSMLAKHPGMDEHVQMVREKVTEIASALNDGGWVGAASSTAKIAYQFVTAEGIVMDAVLTIKVDAKPAKPEE